MPIAPTPCLAYVRGSETTNQMEITMQALFVENMFCPNNTWQVCLIGTLGEVYAGVQDARAQGVKAIGDSVRNCLLWDTVAGDKTGPILSGGEYTVLKRKA